MTTDTTVETKIGIDPPSKAQIKPLLIEAFTVQGARDATRKAGDGLSGKIIKMAIKCGNAGGLERVKVLAQSLAESHAFIKELEDNGIHYEMNKKRQVKMPAAWTGPFNTAANVYKFGLSFVEKAKDGKETVLAESALRKQVASVQEKQRNEEQESALLESVGKEGAFLVQRCQAALSFIGKSLFEFDTATLEAVTANLVQAHDVAKAYAEAKVQEAQEKVIPPVGPTAEAEADEDEEQEEQKPVAKRNRSRRRA